MEASLSRLRTADSGLYQHVSNALKVINDSISSYGLEKLALAFNGGKDCTVLLHLLHHSLSSREAAADMNKKPRIGVFDENLMGNGNDNDRGSIGLKGMSVFMFDTHPQFKEVDEFISDIASTYKLFVRKIKANSIRDALFELKKSTSASMIFSGSRLSDYKGGDGDGKVYDYEMKSDAGWPEMTRIHPLLHWDASDVWKCIHYFKIPYCKLYRMGYTSLGDPASTSRNPKLLKPKPDGEGEYLPAWELDNSEHERVGRL